MMTKAQLIAVLMLWVLWGCSMIPNNTMTTPAQSLTNTGSQVAQVVIQNPLTEQQISQLTYIIQEEKLAYDVYKEMYETRWNRKFANILNSEDNHQDRVAVILKAYNIDYQLSDQRGVYDDPTLTQLYSDLIAQWSQSLDQAMQVGITMEQKDIADIQDMIPWFANYPDISSMLQALLSGSQNHLAAFQK